MKDIKIEHVPYYDLRRAMHCDDIEISKLKQLLEGAEAMGATHMDGANYGVYCLREETDEEYERRMQVKAERIETHRKEEYELYLRLKKKYEASL